MRELCFFVSSMQPTNLELAHRNRHFCRHQTKHPLTRKHVMPHQTERKNERLNYQFFCKSFSFSSFTIASSFATRSCRTSFNSMKCSLTLQARNNSLTHVNKLYTYTTFQKKKKKNSPLSNSLLMRHRFSFDNVLARHHVHRKTFHRKQQTKSNHVCIIQANLVILRHLYRPQ